MRPQFHYYSFFFRWWLYLVSELFSFSTGFPSWSWLRRLDRGDGLWDGFELLETGISGWWGRYDGLELVGIDVENKLFGHDEEGVVVCVT